MLDLAIKMLVAVVALAGVAHFSGLLERGRLPVPAPQAEAAAAADDIVADDGAREIQIPPHDTGHFLVEIAVNGTEVPFLVDTGASHVVLSRSDAARIGIDLGWLTYSHRAQTANGVVRLAPVELDEMRLGALELRDVVATVNEADMPISLLGMSFLGRLDGYEVRENHLILRY